MANIWIVAILTLLSSCHDDLLKKSQTSNWRSDGDAELPVGSDNEHPSPLKESLKPKSSNPTAAFRLFGATSGPISKNAVTKTSSVIELSNGDMIVGGETSVPLLGNEQNGSYDCFIARLKAGGDLIWSKQIGVSDESVNGCAVANDSQGNFIVATTLSGEYGGSTTGGEGNIVVLKLAADGSKVWSQVLGVADKSASFRKLAVNAAGYVFLTGYTTGAFPGNLLTGLADVVLVKLAPDGTVNWVRQFGAASKSYTDPSLAVDGDGNAYVTVTTEGGLDDNLLTGLSDVYIAKFDSAGTKKWSHQLGAPGASSLAKSIGCDSAGNVIVGGGTDGSFDGQVKTGAYDYFLTKWKPDGIKLWTVQKSYPNAFMIGDILGITEDGSIYSAGRFGGKKSASDSAISSNFYLAKHGSDGAFVSTQNFGDYSTHQILDLRIGKGATYVVGTATGPVGPTTAISSVDGYVAKLSQDGSYTFVKRFGGSGWKTEVSAMAASSEGKFVVAGNSDGQIDGQGVLGVADLFVKVMDKSGVHLWTKRLGAKGAETYPTGAAYDSAGELVVTFFSNTNVSFVDGSDLHRTPIRYARFSVDGGIDSIVEYSTPGITFSSAAAVATASDRGPIIVGRVNGSFDSGTVTTNGDYFVAHFSVAGQKLWIHQDGKPNFTSELYSVAISESGSVFAGGYVSGPYNLPVAQRTTAGILVKYDSNGQKLWRVDLGAGKFTSVSKVAALIEGGVVVVGQTTEALDGVPKDNSNLTGFIAKYSDQGKLVWLRQLHSKSGASGLTIDTDGNEYVSGVAWESINGEALEAKNGYFLVKFDPAGATLWTRVTGAKNHTIFPDGLVWNDTMRTLMIYGSTDGSLYNLPRIGVQDGFVAGVDTDGRPSGVFAP